MVAVSENLQAIVTQISAFLAAARTQAAAGMTWQKFGELLVQLLLVPLVEQEYKLT